MSQPWGTANDNPTGTAVPPVPGPACRWRGRQDSRREGCSQTAGSRLACTQRVPAGSAPASPSLGAGQAAHGPCGSRLAFPGSALGWHCGLVRIPWRRQYSPLCRCELGIRGTGHTSTGEGTERAGSGVTPTPAPLVGLFAEKGEEVGCVQMVSVKRSQFLLSPPLSPVTSSVISVLPALGAPAPASGPGTHVLAPLVATRSGPPGGSFLGANGALLGQEGWTIRHQYPGCGSCCCVEAGHPLLMGSGQLVSPRCGKGIGAV